jgi:hypothetical protein
MIGGLTLLSLQLTGIPGAGAEIPAAPAPVGTSLSQLRDEELMLLAMVLDNMTLTETLTAYGDPSDPLLPVSELARLLDLDVTVLPSEQRITGQLGEARRSLIVDLPTGLARVGGSDIALTPQDVALSQTDIFIRASVLERLLPLKLKVEPENLLITLTATEKLPVQARMEREGRLRGLGPNTSSADPVLRIESPYRLFSPPAFDVALETGHDSTSGRTSRRYDIRTAGDLLYTGFTGYLGSDEVGGPSNARVEFERRSPGGGLLGPLDATYVAGGDVFTPSLALGARSIGGRGFSFTTAKLEQASVFQRITLRGELPIGYDVELYINDVLRSGQRSPVEGRYEFLDVPLTRGLNVIRIVTYGPRGERSEQTRVINVGGGQLAPGETSVDFGLVQQDRSVIELGSRDDVPPTPGYGKLRATANVAHGVREDLTLVGGVALYPGAGGEERKMLTLGARGSLFGMAVQGDVASDFTGGKAAALGIAGQPFGASVVARHVEYAGGFVDETNRLLDLSRPLSRHSELTLDFSLPPIGGKIIPLSFRLERAGFADGGSSWTGLGRASATIASTLVSAGLDYQRNETPNAGRQERLSGNIAASRFIDYKWQVRGVLDYDLIPASELRSLSVTADRQLSGKLGFRLGAGRIFGDQKDFSVQGGAFWRLPIADVALTGDYATAAGTWRVGLRVAFGLAFDPTLKNYRITRPGPAAGASAVFHAFTDSNGNGVFDRGEDPVPGVAIEGIERKVVTGPDGRAFVTGLGDSVSGRIKANIEGSEAFFVNSPPQDIEFSPRAGDVILIPYPLAPVSEVMAHVRLRQEDGKMIGISGVRVRLVSESREPIETATEFDGSAIFSDVRPGTYRFELDPDQAARLKMRLAAPVAVTVGEDGMVKDVAVEVIFAGIQD